MKTKFTLLLFMFAFFGIKAQQLPNVGFETWTNPLAPDGWATYESAVNIPLGLASKDTSDKAMGTSSLKLRADSISVAPQVGVVGGLVSLGTSTYSSMQNRVNYTGIPFPFRPDTLFFVLKYSTPGTDTPTFLIALYDTAFVLGVKGLSPKPASWALGYFPLTSYYLNTRTPDSLFLQFSTSNVKPVKNSTLKLDDVYFTYKNFPTLIEDIKNDIVSSAFPNPANGVISISVNKTSPYSSIIIFDINGRVIRHQFMDGNKQEFDVRDWAAGFYNYSIIDSEGVVKSKGRFVVAK